MRAHTLVFAGVGQGVGCTVQVPGGNLTCAGRQVLGKGHLRRRGGVRVDRLTWNALGEGV